MQSEMATKETSRKVSTIRDASSNLMMRDVQSQIQYLKSYHLVA